jgi:transposase
VELAEALHTIDLLRGHIEALEVQLMGRDATIQLLTNELILLRFQCERHERARFGDNRERVTTEEPALPGVDLSVHNDNAAEAPAAPPPEETEKKKKGSGRKRRKRLQVDPACVTQKHVTIEPESIACRCCGKDMVVIGEVTSSVTERIPARYEETITHRPKYACNRCRQGGVVIAPAPEPLVTGAGGVGVSLAADIAVMHYADHLPFHRLAGIFLREGLQIDRSTLGRVAQRVALALRRLVEAMRKELLRGDGVVGIDGTHMKIFAKKRCQRRTVYVLHGGGHVVFIALKSANAVAIFEGFEDFRGVVECDAATVHLGEHSQKLGLLIALCNAHGRRNFFDARGTDTPRANHALAFFQEVAQAEREWRDLDDAKRQRQREEVLAPRFKEFLAWLVAERPSLVPRSPMAQAFDYALSHWAGLTHFLRDGRVSWTNNTSERLLRHIVVGRKAWVYRGSFEGAELGCVLWSLMMSCRLHGIDPRQHLLDTLAALGDTPTSRVLDLTPKAYAERLRAAREESSREGATEDAA